MLTTVQKGFYPCVFITLECSIFLSHDVPCSLADCLCLICAQGVVVMWHCLCVAHLCGSAAKYLQWAWDQNLQNKRWVLSLWGWGQWESTGHFCASLPSYLIMTNLWMWQLEASPWPSNHRPVPLLVKFLLKPYSEWDSGKCSSSWLKLG
jgi:hypothetical protein